MSKKLIAIAAAAALALTGLVAVPASANVSVVFSVPNANGDGSDDALAANQINTTAATTTVAAIQVPATNSLTYSSTANRLVKAVVSAATGTTVSVTTTGKVRVIDEETDTTNKYTSASGLESWSKAAVAGSVTFYIYTTSIEKGSVKITVGANTTERFLFATPGGPYQMTVTLPTTVGTAAPTDPNTFATVVDLFGNTIENASVTGTVTSGTLTGGSPATANTWTWDSTDKRYEARLSNSTAGPFAVTATLGSPQAAVTGFTRNISFFGTVNSVDAAAQVTALTAQVAALTEQLAATVTKAKYNKLAKRWNKANPGNKVKLAN